jgi:NAD(P)-dependent dehydrogenase (short-subunit alcohol dehydrogenase family)
MVLKDKTALITGAGAGLGRAIALAFAGEGARLVVSDRGRAAETETEIRRSGGRCLFVRADATQDKDVSALVEQAKAEMGRIDILVNNAGGVIEGTVISHTLDEWKRVMDLNVTSVFLVSHYVLPIMEENGGGVVLNMSSEVGLKGFGGRAGYTAGKSAIIGLTKAMAVDHADQGIRVNALCPGTVLTPGVQKMIDVSADPDKKMAAFISRRLTGYLGTPEDIAHAALFLCSPQARYFNGAIIPIDGGSTAR